MFAVGNASMRARPSGKNDLWYKEVNLLISARSEKLRTRSSTSWHVYKQPLLPGIFGQRQPGGDGGSVKLEKTAKQGHRDYKRDTEMGRQNVSENIKICLKRS